MEPQKISASLSNPEKEQEYDAGSIMSLISSYVTKLWQLKQQGIRIKTVQMNGTEQKMQEKKSTHMWSINDEGVDVSVWF